VLADRFEGRRFNSPNDVVERADGSIWFTDPSYGIDSVYEGGPAASEIGACHVYRIDPGGRITVVADDFDRPNGLAFSADEQRLYIADSGRDHIRVFGVTGDSELTGGEVLISCNEGTFDGLRVDAAGHLWGAAGDGLHCVHPDGTLLGRLHVPETVANFTFGGRRGNQLFICATTSLYTIMVSVTGAAYPAA
jgi:gluconolactonase